MRYWKCIVCGYIHEGPEPPDVCPVCGAPKEDFIEVTADGESLDAAPIPTDPAAAAAPAAPALPIQTPAPGPSAQSVVPSSPPQDQTKSGLFAITYGMFVVSSAKDGKYNAQAANTVFQITGDPARVAIGINKLNYTHEFISTSGVFAVTVLGKGNMKDIKRFGFSSGRTVDKFQGVDIRLSPTLGCPLIPDGVAFLECRVRPEMTSDAGTHSIFVGDVVGGGPLRSQEPISYEFYRANRAKPPQIVDNVDWNNVVASLEAEYGAGRGYEVQKTNLQNPDLVSALEGIRRSEGEHAAELLAYLCKTLPHLGVSPEPKGWATALFHLRTDLEAEETARAKYNQFAKETADPELRDMFLEQSRSEAGHIGTLKDLIGSIEREEAAVKFFCPLCGWENDFGTKPSSGATITCPKCGARLTLGMRGNDWIIRREK